MGLNLEGNSPAVTNIGHTGVLTDTDHQVLLHLIGDLRTELLQMNLRRLVGAVLGPHDRVHCQLSRGRTATKNLLNILELILLQTQFGPGSSVSGVAAACSTVSRLNCFSLITS